MRLGLARAQLAVRAMDDPHHLLHEAALREACQGAARPADVDVAAQLGDVKRSVSLAAATEALALLVTQQDGELEHPDTQKLLTHFWLTSQ